MIHTLTQQRSADRAAGTAGGLGMRAMAAWACVVASSTASLGQAPPAAPSAEVSLQAAGDGASTWVFKLRTDPGGEQKFLQFAHAAIGKPFRRPTMVATVDGMPAAVAVVDGRLHLFFKSGSHYSYDDADSDVELELPTVPQVVAGAGDGKNLLAIVPASVYNEIRESLILASLPNPDEEEGASMSETQPARTTWLAAPEVDVLPPEFNRSSPLSRGPGLMAADKAGLPRNYPPAEHGFAIVRYRRGRWLPGIAFPAWMDGHVRAWMCHDKDRLFVFFTESTTGGPLRVASCEAGLWRPPQRVDTPEDARQTWAVSRRGNPVVVAAMAHPRESGRVTLRAFREGPAGWISGEAFRFGDVPETAAFDLSATAVAGFGENILCAWNDDHGTVRWAAWSPTGGKPVIAPEPLAALDAPREPLLPPNTRNALTILVLAAVLVTLFWRRKTAVGSHAELPHGVRVATVWQRAAAGLIDTIVVALAMVWYWAPRMIEFLRAAEANLPTAPDRFSMMWLLFVSTYGAYSAFWELLAGASPGKWLLRIRVVNEQGLPCRFWQVLLRNVVRCIEMLPEFSPSLVLMALTRNHQRMGDLLARTLVVHHDTTSDLEPLIIDDPDQPVAGA